MQSRSPLIKKRNAMGLQVEAAKRDWKAADRLLSLAKETRDEYGAVQDKGPKIILSIHRDEVIIDG